MKLKRIQIIFSFICLRSLIDRWKVLREMQSVSLSFQQHWYLTSILLHNSISLNQLENKDDGELRQVLLCGWRCCRGDGGVGRELLWYATISTLYCTFYMPLHPLLPPSFPCYSKCREIYLDAKQHWVHCAHCTPMASSQDLRLLLFKASTE